MKIQFQKDIDPLFDLMYDTQLHHAHTTPNQPSSVQCLISVKRGLQTVTALLGSYHTDNSFIPTLKYTILSTNVFITAYTHTFFPFQDGYTLHNSYTENSLHVSFLYISIYFYILVYILNHTF